jgi:hypothetical protein
MARIGCACGRYVLNGPAEVFEVRGTIHRANRPCYAGAALASLPTNKEQP